MAKLNSKLLGRLVYLLPIPLLWCALSYFGVLQSAENSMLAVRYRFRGEINSPVKVAYVNVDTRALQLLGERPWDRSDFATAARVLLTEGKAKTVGFDFVFSDISFSKLVPRTDMARGNRALGLAARDFPSLILAANFAGGQGRLLDDAERRQFPYLRLGYTDRNKNDLPELPTEPMIGAYMDRATGNLIVYGSVGLIDVDYTYDGADRPPRGWPYFHEGDVIPRWVPLFALTPNPAYYHLSVQLARFALGVESSGIRQLDDRIELVRPDGEIAASIPMREGQMLEANWFSKWDSEPLNLHESFADVLQFAADLKSENPAEQQEARAWFEKFRDAVVLIGPTDPLLQDLAPTPLDESPVPKVGLHGNLVKTIVSGLYIKRPTTLVIWALIFALSIGLTLLVTAAGARSLLSKVAGVMALAAYVMISLQLFADRHWVVPLVGPLGAAFTTSFAALIWQVLDEEKQKGRIKGMFGTYLSPALVNRMVEGEEPKLGGIEENITAYFSDIQSFSGFSEKLTPPRLVALMNEYLTACTDIVQAEGGTLDKYIGDAVVAMYGAPLALPDHGYRACVAALRVQCRIGELREKWRQEKEKEWPDIVLNLQNRIGLNSGPAVVGNMGSNSRFSYTMMGDNVNIASRMESGAKKWGVYTMCPEATKIACEQHGGDRVIFRALGRIVVQGRVQALPIYEVAALKEHITESQRECYRVFALGLEKFYARDWSSAADLFQQSEQLEPNRPGTTPGISSNPSLVYLEMTAQYRHEPPPPDWTGVHVMSEK